MPAKATHYGECQICGSRQLLPDGVLSKHGYTVKWGFFSGVCHGSGYLPFEQSKDQIAAAVAAVETTIAEVEVTIAQLEDINSEVNGKHTAWSNIYHRGGHYAWEQVEVVEFAGTKYESGSTNYCASIKRKLTEEDKRYRLPRTRVDGDSVVESINAYDKSWHLASVRHWVHFLNCKYADSLRKGNDSRRAWVAWQGKRVAEWSVKPLTPRKG